MLQALISWEALGLYSLVGIGATFWFVPFLRRYAMIAGGAILGLLFIYSKGKRDERKRQAERTRQAIQRQEEARRAAERSVSRGVSTDPRDRDSN